MIRAPIELPLRWGDTSSAVTHPSWVEYFQRQSALRPVYANNATARAGGLNVGDEYRTGGDPDLICQVH